MSWKLRWTEHALHDVERLDRQTRERVVAALERLAKTGHGDVKRLKSQRSEWRLRVGKWRARLTFDPAAETVLVLRVLPREAAYRE